MMDFSAHAGAASSFDTIPAGQVAFCVLNVRGVKASASGGEYVDCELTVDQGQPYAGRKFWEMIGNPFHNGNSEKYRQMGMTAITRICEAARGAHPGNPDGYKLQDFSQLNGLRVPVKIGVEEGEGGHEDKNRVSEWLTPNPASKSGYKHYERLMKGEFAPASSGQAQPAAGGFGGQQQGGFGSTGNSAGSSGAAPAATSGFGGGQTSGFGQTAPGSSAPGNGFAQTAGNPSSTTAASASPSETPGWLAQANGGAPAQ